MSRSPNTRTSGMGEIDTIKKLKSWGLLSQRCINNGNNNIEIISVISPTYLKLDRCFVKDIESENIISRSTQHIRN
ncbi:hypothetical protein O9929_11685 [Vibrio lentus]|nr:hypothetical protein [Vibrio lentus]